ncbi:MAG TPA: hypothetical protein VLV55_14725 [Rhizomicrobium sp.]|nr:hypothetical protein [Rhizomicrobium sp.]
MGRRTGNPRGAPKGNTNRLKHGRWGREFAAYKAEVDALLREAKNAVIRANMVVRARRNLARRVTAMTMKERRAGSSPAQRGRGTMRSMVEGAGASAPLAACGGTPPASGGRNLWSHEYCWPNFYKTRAGPMDSFAAQTIGA